MQSLRSRKLKGHMPRSVLISGLGPVSGLGLGIDPTWDALAAGRCAIGPISAFDATGFDCSIGAEVSDFKVSQFVPKWYRKATKVMARDIELAVAAADLAARDARLVTKSTADEGQSLSYDSTRMGAHIGAGLIAAELNELTAALVEARDDHGRFDYHKWGGEGINHLTPLWLLKYLPNMLACHVTILHDAQGPSNTITCGEASGGLSLGESLRVIRRGAAEMCFCGGTDSKLNPMGFLRQIMTGRVNTRDNDSPAKAVRPFCRTAAGTICGEGGGIVVLEAADSFEKRASADGARAYAQMLGFGASQTVHHESRNMLPDPQGRGIALALGAALRDARISPDDIDLIVPFGLGLDASDTAEANALATVFGERLAQIPLVCTKSMAGNCAAGASGLDICVVAKAVAEQMLPAVINCDQPRDGLHAASAPARRHDIRYALTYSCGQGGQNAAIVLARAQT